MSIDEPEAPRSRALERDVEAAAMRRRIAAQLFGAEPEAVTIGRFVVIEALGRGGMGIVYAALDRRLQRQVALKLIDEEHVGDDPRERERLLHEARALARLSHPNVVQVYEVGEHAGGVFLVMEMVRGVTLRQWLDLAERPLSEIVDRFLEAARGLEAAHRAGIVHRDFKPSNVLVGDDGRVRLVDFGLARAPAVAEPSTEPVDPGATAPSDSRSRDAAGTPAYMSPEHLRGRCDARSDQFSFCVALFEALHGHRPYTVDELLQMSLRPGGSSAPPAGSRPVPRGLQRLLARGLSAHPQDRHASMTAVIQALARVQSRGRRRASAFAGALVLAGGVTLGALGRDGAPERCPDPGERLAGVWDEPRRAAVRAAFTDSGLAYATQAWLRSEQALDAYAARWVDARRDTCAATWLRGEQSEDSLDRSNRCLDGALRAFAGLTGYLAAADPTLIAEADALVADLPDPASCRELAARGRRFTTDPALASMLERARIHERTQQPGEAVAALSNALARSRRLGDLGAEAEALLLLGRIRGRALREPHAAWQTLHEAFDRANLADRPDLLWPIWAEMALVAGYELERLPDAWLWLGHARSALGEAAGERERVALLAVESQLLAAADRGSEAVERRREILDLLARLHPAEHPEVMLAREDLANSMVSAGTADAALRLREPQCRELAGLHGPDHPRSARCELDLGLDLLELDRPSEARGHVERARAVLAATYGATSTRVATAELALARIDAAEGRLARALTRGETALAIYGARLPRGHNDRVAALATLAELYRAAGRLADLLRIQLELLRIHDEEDTSATIDLPGVLINIGECLCDLGRCSEALPIYTRLLAHYEAAPPDEAALQAFPFRGLGRVHLASDAPALAIPYLERAFAIFAAAPATDDERAGLAAAHAATATELADALASLGHAPRRVRELRRDAAELACRDPATRPASCP